MTKMPFWVNNAACTFQRTMELNLQGTQWETCLYIDNIFVYARNFEGHVNCVAKVLDRINAAGLKLKPEKLAMPQTEVVFLLHIASGKEYVQILVMCQK